MHAITERAGVLGSANQQKSNTSIEQQSGFKVIKSDNSMANAIEELSISLSQSKKKRKTVAIKKDGVIKNREMLNQYFKNSASLNKDSKYQQVFEEIRMTKFKTREQLIGFIEKKIDGIGDQYLMLEKMKDDLNALIQEENSPQDQKALVDLHKLVDKSIAEILNKNPQKILASLNVSNAVYKFVDIEPNKSVDGMLKFYFNAIIGYKDLADVLRYIQNNFDTKFMFQTIDFLLESTAIDLSSPLISMQEVKLRVINDDIFKLRVLKDLYRSFQKMIVYMRRLEEEEVREKEDREKEQEEHSNEG